MPMGCGMGSSLASGSGIFRRHRESVRNSGAVHVDHVDRRAYRTSSRRTSFNDWIPVVCFLALVGVVVIGGLLMLFSWVTARFPASARMACPQLSGCVVPAPDGVQSVLGDDTRANEPKLTP